MGIFDSIKDKADDMGGSLSERYEELRAQEQLGQLDDKGREELNQLKERFGQ